MSQSAPNRRNPWAWIPSLYFAEGLPYIVVMSLAVLMYKRMGISNTDIALYTSWLGLPWVFKPFWSPLVDMLRTKRFWIVFMQLLIGAGLAGVAFTLPADRFEQYTLAFLFLVAFSSATHDIAADGFYMIDLREDQQSFFVGIRSTFYRLAMLTGQGLIVIFAGYLEASSGLPPIELEIQSRVGVPLVQDSIDFGLLDLGSEQGEAALLASQSFLQLAPEKRDATWASALKQQVEQWNLDQGFYEAEITAQSEGEASWWTRQVSQPLGQWLRRNFGPETTELALDEGVGNLTWVAFRPGVSPDAGQQMIVNLDYISGDKSIKLAGPSRFRFTADNWQQAAVALFQLDPNLEGESSATFRAVSGNLPLAWSLTFVVLMGMMLVLGLYHRFALPRPPGDRPLAQQQGFWRDYFQTIFSFFRKKHIWLTLGFILFYRFGEAQLAKLAQPFLIDSQALGGLGLTTGEVGLIYGTVGLFSLVGGGILGGILAARQGLKYWIWWMLIAINLPNLVYIYLAYAQPDSLWVIGSGVAIEQFGYGFGFTAFLLYLIYVSDGPTKTAHYAIATGLMALGLILPGMMSGWIQEQIGYPHFFIWVMLATIPAFVITYFLPIDPEFGKRKT